MTMEMVSANAAGILADKNHFPGIDIVKFEKTSVSFKRERLSKTHRPWMYMKRQ